MLKENNGKFLWLGGFDTKHLPKEAGFRWDPDRKVWWTQFIDNASKLLNYATPELKEKLQKHLENKSESIIASKAATAEIDPPVPAGLQYLPFQKAGISYALKHTNVLLGDSMGLGKTMQAIGVLNSIEWKNCLIITPASLKINWSRELKKWLVKPRTIAIAEGNGFPVAEIVIINYDMLKKYEMILRTNTWDVLIVDESHYLKNDDAIRTQQVLGKKEKVAGQYIQTLEPIPAKRKMFLTGTPIPNRPIEGWAIFSALAPDIFPSFWGYAKRYCDAQQNGYGWDISGSSNLDELQEKLRANIMVRRLKEDVLPELPPKRRQVIELPMNGSKESVSAELDAISKHETELTELKIQVEIAKAGDKDEYKDAVQKLKDAASVAFTEISKLRHETALSKLPHVIAHIKDVIDERKVVVFAHHHDVIQAIVDAFPGSVKLTGENAQNERQDAIDKFQTDPNCRLFVGSIMAAGVGITLTAASHVIFAELDWVPGNITQAEDRLHRIGQKDSVLVQHLVVDSSLDARMARTLVEKQAIIDQALDDDFAGTPIIPLEEPATKAVTQKSIIELNPDEILTVHTQLKILSARCDGAVYLDGVGFNKIDAGIGKRLADLGTLTPRQASLGKLIVTKYRKQLGE